jgi:hypothetical protein
MKDGPTSPRMTREIPVKNAARRTIISARPRRVLGNTHSGPNSPWALWLLAAAPDHEREALHKKVPTPTCYLTRAETSALPIRDLARLRHRYQPSPTAARATPMSPG